MMRRIVLVLITASCAVTLMAPLACGKYASPKRLTQPRLQPQKKVPEQVQAGGVADESKRMDPSDRSDREDEAQRK